MLHKPLLVRAINAIGSRLVATATAITRAESDDALNNESSRAWIVLPPVLEVELEKLPVVLRSRSRELQESLREEVQSQIRFWLKPIGALPCLPFVIAPNARDRASSQPLIVKLVVRTLGELPDCHATIDFLKHYDDRKSQSPLWPGAPNFAVAPEMERMVVQLGITSGMCLVVETANTTGPMALLLESEVDDSQWRARLFWVGEAPELRLGTELWRHLNPRNPQQDRTYSGIIATVSQTYDVAV